MPKSSVHRDSKIFKLIVILVFIILIFNTVGIAVASHTNQESNGSYPTYLPVLSNSSSSGSQSWYMLGANPERTSWVPEEVPGRLKPLWYKQFESYIPNKVQIITAYSTLYISTSNGLYALDAETGAEKWIYPTELPLGHSPTVYNGVVYVGGFDRMLHAINAFNGQRIWTFTAGAGFDTNPLVINGLVLIGNRDGYFYAINSQGPQIGQLAWKFQTGGPIDFSAAYKDGVVYFAAEDSYAYALKAQTGKLVWKSEKLLGAGFRAWWPVIYGDWVIFSGSQNYRNFVVPGDPPESQYESNILFPNNNLDPRGTLIGPLSTEPGSWAKNTPTINTSQPQITQNGSTTPVTNYFEQDPWRRTYFVLNRTTGAEYTTDFNGDGKPEYAPILWLGTNSQNRYPPVVGSDNILYQANNYMSDHGGAGGQVSGWKFGTPFISVISSGWSASDEPLAYSAGGNLIYWNLCCDRVSGAIDISKPDTEFSNRYIAGIQPPTGTLDNSREWTYFQYNLDELLPGYSMYYNGTNLDIYSAFGNRDGVYGYHGLQNPPIPYNGKVYMQRGNSVIAFAPDVNQPVHLPMAKIIPYQDPSIQTPSVESLKSTLSLEVQKMIDNGHLRTGYSSSGMLDISAQNCGDDLMDYWHNPGDTIYTLIQALPYLPPDLQQPTKDYIQTEFINFPPYLYNHIGWKDGAPRETFILPPEVAAQMQKLGPQTYHYDYPGWQLAPNSFYALWKYATVFGGAVDIYNASKSQLEPVPSDNFLLQNPQVLNAYIAGYLGFLKLEQLAHYPESLSVRDTYNRILALRANTFSKVNPDLWFADLGHYYCRSFSVSMNFMYLVPELGQYLHDNALTKVTQALDEYTYLAPYWFEAKSETAFGEGVINNLYNYPTIFAAKAMILKEPYTELAKYIDVPATATGDLFYIQNLILAIEAGNP
jgi:outer membrane protein assembly factor BamB